MADDAGPIQVIELAALDLAPALPPGTVGGLDGQADFDRDLEELTADLWRMSERAMEDWGPELEQLGGEAAEGLAQDDAGVGEEEFGDPEAAAEETDGLMVSAHEEIPAEAWQEIPAPYAAPPDYSDYYAGAPTPGAPAPTPGAPTLPPAPAPGGQWVAITNLDRPGEANYWVGDRWRVDAVGPPFQAVTIHAWQDGVDRGTAQVGISDGEGRFVLFGSMGAEHAGQWVEEWSMGGSLLDPILTFTVF